MSKQQYINASNKNPSMVLGFPWLLALTTYVLNWPTWIYGVVATMTVLLITSFIYRLVTEEGVDVVKRG